MSVIHTRERTPQIVRAGTFFPHRPTTVRPAPPPETGMTGRDVVRILRKRIWLVFFSLVICVSLSIVATLLWRTYWPWYTTAALLEVRAPETTSIEPMTPFVPGPTMEALAAKYVSLARGETVLETAVNTDRIRNTTWFRRSPDDAVQRLGEELTVTAQAGSALIMISMRGTNTSELPEIVNAVADAAQARGVEMQNQATQRQIRQLATELSSLTEQRDRIRAEKSKLVRDASEPDMLDRTTGLTAKLNSLRLQVSAMEVEYTQSEASLELIRTQMRSGQIEQLPQVIQALDYDLTLRQLRTTFLSYKAREKTLKAKFGEKHRAVRDFKAHVKNMEAEIDTRKKELIDAQVNSMVANAESRKAIVLDRLAKLREQLRETDAGVRGLRATLGQYRQLDGKDTDLTEKIARIGERLMDLRILVRGSAPLAVMQIAPTPVEPSWPKWVVMVPVGVVLGLFFGLGLAFLLELIDTSIKGPADITKRVDLPLLGMVPHQDDLEENVKDFRLAFSTHPNSLVSEAFRQIRTCLQFSGPASQRRSLLVTSPLPEDGRTTVSLNLAASAARNGRKVLVVDANFRQPMIRTLFSAAPEGGLSTALVGQADWREMVLDIEPNFSVMASGPLPPNPGELLGSEQMSAIISDMVAEYDQVIFDAAPCLLVTDAPALSTLVDGALLVIRAGANTYGIVQRTREMLNRIGGHVVGVVLNGVRAMAGGYLRKNYEAFYDYHERAKLPQK